MKALSTLIFALIGVTFALKAQVQDTLYLHNNQHTEGKVIRFSTFGARIQLDHPILGRQKVTIPYKRIDSVSTHTRDAYGQSIQDIEEKAKTNGRPTMGVSYQVRKSGVFFELPMPFTQYMSVLFSTHMNTNLRKNEPPSKDLVWVQYNNENNTETFQGIGYVNSDAIYGHESTMYRNRLIYKSGIEAAFRGYGTPRNAIFRPFIDILGGVYWLELQDRRDKLESVSRSTTVYSQGYYTERVVYNQKTTYFWRDFIHTNFGLQIGTEINTRSRLAFEMGFKWMTTRIQRTPRLETTTDDKGVIISENHLPAGYGDAFFHFALKFRL